MSAFVIDQNTMHRVVRGICASIDHGFPLMRRFAGIETSDPSAPTEIGRRLFTLNIEAIQQRYPDTLDKPDNMPGTVGCHRYPRTYRAKTANRSPCSVAELLDSLKAMQCLRYQCSEGDVPGTKLFVELQLAISAVAEAACRKLPEYERAAWDSD